MNQLAFLPHGEGKLHGSEYNTMKDGPAHPALVQLTSFFNFDACFAGTCTAITTARPTPTS